MCIRDRFREVVVESPVPVDELQRSLLEHGIDAGFDISAHFPYMGKNLVQFSFSGMNSMQEMGDLLEALKAISKRSASEKDDGTRGGVLSEIPDAIKRDTRFEIPSIPETVLRKIILLLGKLNYNPKKNPVPLGSCTMMDNPIVNEIIAAFPEFADLHPDALPEMVQGTLQVLYELAGYLKEITGMDDSALNPAAGAHGELSGITTCLLYTSDAADE